MVLLAGATLVAVAGSVSVLATTRGRWDDLAVGLVAVAAALVIARRSTATSCCLVAWAAMWFAWCFAHGIRPWWLWGHRPLLALAMLSTVRARRHGPRAVAVRLAAAGIAATMIAGWWDRDALNRNVACWVVFGAIAVANSDGVRARVALSLGAAAEAAWVLAGPWPMANAWLGLALYRSACLATIVLVAVAVVPVRRRSNTALAIDLGLLDGRRRPADPRLVVVDPGTPMPTDHTVSFDFGDDGIVAAWIPAADAADLDLAGELQRSASMLATNRRLNREVSEQISAVTTSRERLRAVDDRELLAFGRALESTVLPTIAALMHEIPDDAADLRDMLDELTADLHEMATGRPVSTLRRGLAGALADLVGQCQLDGTLHAEPISASVAVEQIMWFVAVEAVTNAVRHAQARSVQVHLTQPGRSIRLEIVDDGNGDVDEAAGSGLAGLRHRVESTGGSFHVTGVVGHGTRVEATMPS
jgi:signal transduction histidine kinase